MKVFIMTDLEGVAGVQDSSNWCLQEGRFYGTARGLLTAEVNAAIEGFLEAGASRILVADGHGSGALEPEGLHPKAELARNWSAGGFSIDEDKFDFAAWVGQHPMAGTVGGHLCHTGNMGVVEQSVNGIKVGEFGDLVLIASELGIRSVFASGCRAFCREAAEFVPGIETAAVKRGSQAEPGDHLPALAYRQHNISAVHLHPREARRRIKNGARKAVERALKEEFGLVKLPEPPYVRIRIMRGDGERPPRIMRQEHPDSLLLMRGAEVTVRELLINPADARLRTLTGRPV